MKPKNSEKFGEKFEPPVFQLWDSGTYLKCCRPGCSAIVNEDSQFFSEMMAAGIWSRRRFLCVYGHSFIVTIKNAPKNIFMSEASRKELGFVDHDGYDKRKRDADNPSPRYTKSVLCVKCRRRILNASGVQKYHPKCKAAVEKVRYREIYHPRYEAKRKAKRLLEKQAP